MLSNTHPPSDSDRVAEFLRRYLQATGMALDFSIHPLAAAQSTAPTLEIRFRGPDVPLLLDRRAELLNALEHLAAKLLGLAPEEHHRVRFDAANYKSGRDQELQALTQQAIREVTASGHPFRLPPMNSRERRLVHLLIAEAGLRSLSSGEGPFRSVTVHPGEATPKPTPPQNPNPTSPQNPETAARLARLRKNFTRR